MRRENETFAQTMICPTELFGVIPEQLLFAAGVEKIICMVKDFFMAVCLMFDGPLFIFGSGEQRENKKMAMALVNNYFLFIATLMGCFFFFCGKTEKTRTFRFQGLFLFLNRVTPFWHKNVSGGQLCAKKR
jgi:hypothetical protein